MFTEDQLRDLIRRDFKASGRKSGERIDVRAIAIGYESSMFDMTDDQVLVVVRQELGKLGTIS